MSIFPTNNLVKLAIGAGHARRVALADQLYFPVSVDLFNPALPMMGGYVGNRSGQSQRLVSPGAGGNTGGFGADFDGLSGDPVAVVQTMTSDGPIFTVKRYDGRGDITVDDPRINDATSGTVNDFSTVPRYLIKADGYVYDLLELRGVDGAPLDPNHPNFDSEYKHWEISGAAPLAGYDNTTNTYTPPFNNTQITKAMYARRVGQISFRDKQGASSGAIQEQLTRIQSTLDSMSRLMRSLHDEAKGPFANMVIR